MFLKEGHLKKGFDFLGPIVINVRKEDKMAEIVKKQVCECTNCGNEAEMVVTCSLPDSEIKNASTEKTGSKEVKKIKGTATCSRCGNEADMWIEY
jgi:hypothetical protein